MAKYTNLVTRDVINPMMLFLLVNMAAPTDEEVDGQFNPSELGTKEYWDNAYARELENFKDIGDVGEVWFGFDSVQRVVRWLDRNPDVSKESSVLDIGCGNGVLLVELYKEGFTQLTGVDYSEAAISLAKAVAEDEDANITYERGDILENSTCATCLSKSYDICLDKGTYDAISLNPDNSTQKRQQYVEAVQKLTKTNGLFVITSCNWVKDELLQHFKQGFTLLKEIPTPTFQFGGKVGNRETALVFKRT